MYTHVINKTEIEIEKQFTISVSLLKITGLYQILSPHGLKIYGVNIFKCLLAVQVTFLGLANVWFGLNIYHNVDGIHAVTYYLILIMSCLSSIFKQAYLIRHSETIWNRCIRSTAIDRLPYYGHHRNNTLEIGRTKSISIAALFVFLWTAVVMAWLLSPFLVNGSSSMEVRAEHGGIYHYRYNVLNLIFPVNDTFYNDNYPTYYIVESIIVVMWGHGTLIFDVLLISLCITLSYQLKTIVDSYSAIHMPHGYCSTNNGKEITELDEPTLIYNFKLLIQDQQRVNENMRNVYKIFQPAVLLQMFVDSLNITLLLSAITMNYINGLSLVSSINIKYIVSIPTQIMHLFLTCYLFTDIDEQKESLNFGLYSCDWTQKSIYFKKLLLYAMRMNNSHYLKLQFSRQRIVNFEMFANIMRTMYSILSVLSKMYVKRT